MARRIKYDWEKIQLAYEDGIEVNKIVSKYGIAKKTLQNKISADKWEIKGTLDSHIDEFRESLGKITGKVENDPIKQDIIVDKLNTIIEDNEIIGGNRKLARAFQGLMGQGIKKGIYKTPSDIKAGTGALKDIESMANPQASKVELNTEVNSQTVVGVSISEA